MTLPAPKPLQAVLWQQLLEDGLLDGFLIFDSTVVDEGEFCRCDAR